MSRSADGFTWLLLFCTKGLGVKRLHYLHEVMLKEGITARECFDLDKSAFAAMFPRLGIGAYQSIHQQDSGAVERVYAQMLEHGITLVHIGDGEYPDMLLKRMKDEAPVLLFCRGLVSLLSAPGVAVVGSRHASPAALQTAARLVQELSQAGMNVVSGYAGGVDSQAHYEALRNDGTTTAVLSHGILEFTKKRLYDSVRWDGNTLVISQFHPAEKWNARYAMVRNRTVCGLSQAVIVIESGVHTSQKKSGTFDAGEQALAMEVPLFVVSPSALGKCLPGNKELISRGGVEVAPDGAVAAILAHSQVRCGTNKSPQQSAYQLPLL